MNNENHQVYVKNLLPTVGFSILTGALTGAMIFLFKLAARSLEALSRSLYALARLSLVGMLLAFGTLALASLGMILLHRLAPEVKGGGIPRSEGILRGMLSFRAMRTFLGTFLGSMLSFFCGLPLGSEGPAVLIGTSIGRFFGRHGDHTLPRDRYVMTGGAGAAFAIATGAPFSGILFALEEVHKRVSPLLVVTASLATLCASYVNFLLCSLSGTSHRLFEIPSLASYSLSDTGYLFLFGILVAVAVALFDGSIYLFNRLTELRKNILPQPVKLVFFFLLTGALGLFFAKGVYSGHDVIENLMLHRESIWLLLLILAVRLVMMLMATDCGATGGLFIPTLAVGALVSALFARLLMAMGMSEQLYTVTLLLGMCAFLGGTLRSPITAAVFFVELTGQFTELFFVALVIFTVTFLIETLNLTSFYDRVMENMERAQNQGKIATTARFELTISHNAYVVGKSVRDIMWPYSSVILGITRVRESDKDMDHDGEKKLLVGDRVILQIRFYDEEAILRQLTDLAGKEHPIRILSKEE